MSEYINNTEQRKQKIKHILKQLHEGRAVDDLKNEFADVLKETNAASITEVEQMLIDEGLPTEEIQKLCDVHTAVFRESLDAQSKPQYDEAHPVKTFLGENKQAEKILDKLDEVLNAYNKQPGSELLNDAQKQIKKLLNYEKHYVRKENLLFPYLEKYNFVGPSKVMWGIHNDIRSMWKALASRLNEVAETGETIPDKEIDKLWKPLNNAIREMFYKEENILFPASMERLKAEDWTAIREQEADIGYFYIIPKYALSPKSASSVGPSTPTIQLPDDVKIGSSQIKLDTGVLSAEQINLMLRSLPVDITFVDENDKVKFFSESRERVFPRSPAIIGRDVQNCHPPQSVHKVLEIVEAFRAGTRDEAEFWIQMMGKFIHIQYFAVRDQDGTYRGTVEVTQDVGHIRQLEGERRLLDGGA